MTGAASQIGSLSLRQGAALSDSVRLMRSALWYATKFGWPVMPLHSAPDGRCTCGNPVCRTPGKHPRTLHGLKDASKDPHVIQAWPWRESNLGIATGIVSGVVVLDIDPRHGGDDSHDDLQTRHEKLPDTVECLTGGGGRHLYFAHPSGVDLRNSAGALGAGLDIRANGGLVVAPPSLHESGRRYEWEGSSRPNEIEIAPLPGWLGDLLRVQGERTGKSPEEWRELVKGAKEGERNDHVARLAGLLFRRGVDPLAALDLVLCWNATRCKPPLSEDEVKRTVDSIAARENRRREGNARD